MQNKFRLSRRTCLKGLGATLTLPLLETMGWAEAKAAKQPVRLAFMYMPHGVIMDQFWPKSPESFLPSPPPALESLRPVLDQCLLVKGIPACPSRPLTVPRTRSNSPPGSPPNFPMPASATGSTSASPPTRLRRTTSAASRLCHRLNSPRCRRRTRRIRKDSTKATTRTAVSVRPRSRCPPRSTRASC